jgi:hypothetical protein
VLKQGSNSFAVFKADLPEPVSCSEVNVSTTGGRPPFGSHFLRNSRLPPLRIDVSFDSGTWYTIHCQPMPWEEGVHKSAVRCFMPHAVPVISFRNSPLNTQRENVLHDMMYQGQLHLEKELGSYMCGDSPVLSQWPGKESLRRKVVHWLFLHFVPDRDYHEVEVDWVIATKHKIPGMADCAVLRKEFVRCGFMARPGGSSYFQVSSERVLASLQALPLSVKRDCNHEDCIAAA